MKSKQDSFHAFCVLCKCDFSVRHAGRHDVTKHLNTVKHKSYQTAVELTKSVAEFFTPAQDTSIINAEVLCVDFMVEHNLPLAVADHIGPLVRKMFPDSKIAGELNKNNNKFKCVGPAKD